MPRLAIKDNLITPAWMQSLQSHLKEHHLQQTSFGMEELHQLLDQESTYISKKTNVVNKRQTLSINKVILVNVI